MTEIKERYSFSYSNNDLQIARVLLLAIGFLIDLIVIVGVFTCFSAKRYYDIIIYAILIVFSMLLKIVSCFFTYEVTIGFNCGELTIVKKYSIKSILLYKGSCCGIEVEKFYGNTATLKEDAIDYKESLGANANEIPNNINNKNRKRLCSKTCTENLYMLKLNEQILLIALDDYMFSLIEVNSDIS